jgi:hypothetical protein
MRPSCSANASSRSSTASAVGMPDVVVGGVLEFRRVGLGVRFVM